MDNKNPNEAHKILSVPYSNTKYIVNSETLNSISSEPTLETSAESSHTGVSEMKDLMIRPIIVFGSCIIAVVLTFVSFILSSKRVDIGNIGSNVMFTGEDVVILIVSLVVSFLLFGFSMKMFTKIPPVIVSHVIIMAVFCLSLSSVFF